MATSMTYDFSTPSDYTLAGAAVSGGLATISRTTPLPLTKTSNFGTPSDYTYDNTKIAVAASMAALVNSGSVATTFYASMASSINADYAAGSAVGSLFGGASISGGYLVISGNGPHATWPGATNASAMVQQGTVRATFNPQYSGTPSDYQIFYESEQDGTLNNLVQMRHAPTGNIDAYVFNSSGAPIVIINFAFNPTSGTAYEFELDFDVTGGVTNLFLNGVIVANSNATGSRSSSATLISVGFDGNDGTHNANFKVRGIALFPTVQHTANYSAPSPPPVIVSYPTTNPTIALAPGQAISDANLSAITGISATISASGSDSVTFTVSVNGGSTYLYWNGIAWATSSGFGQSNTLAAIVTNLASLPLTTQFQLQAYLHSATGATTPTLANVVVSYTDLVYGSGTVKTNSGFTASQVLSLAATQSIAGSDTILYGLVVNNALLYWNGTIWAPSNGLAAQLNPIATIQANLSTLLTVNSLVQVFFRLTSASGLTTPSVDTVVAQFTLAGVEPGLPSTCLVYGYLLDLSGAPVSGVQVAFQLVTPTPSTYTETAGFPIDTPQALTVTTDATGYFSQALIWQSEFEGTPKLVSVTFKKKQQLINVTGANAPLHIAVPDAVSFNITGLLAG